MAIPTEVYLISVEHQIDDLLQWVPVGHTRQVLGYVSSISASEFFEAGRSGLKPKIRVSMFAPDYQGETTVEVNGVRYGVYRTYMAADDTIELYLERKVGA